MVLLMSPQARETRKNKRMGLHQTKKFLHNKINNQKMKIETTEWENIFVNDISDKVLISKNLKNF